MCDFKMKISRFCGEAVAKYKLYLQQEDQNVAETAKQRRLYEAYWQNYSGIGEVLYDAILNTAVITKLIEPRSVKQLANPKKPVFYASEGFITYTYAGWRYSNYRIITADKVRYTLQEELDNITEFKGVPSLKIHVQFGEKDRVFFYLAIATEVHSMRMKGLQI